MIAHAQAILRGAASLLERQGWAPGGFDREAPLCVWKAIQLTRAENWTASDALDAFVLFRDSIGVPRLCVYDWEFERDRTQDEGAAKGCRWTSVTSSRASTGAAKRRS